MDNWKFQKNAKEMRKKVNPKSLIGSETFLEKLTLCFNEALKFTTNVQTRQRVNQLIGNMHWKLLSHNEIEVREITSCFRTLAFLAKYHDLEKFVDKHFHLEMKNLATTRYDELDILKNDIVYTFILYYQNCLVCSHLKILLEKIDSNFSEQKQMHLKEGRNLVPIISLFKKHTDIIWAKSTDSKSKSWLMVVFQFLKGINEQLAKKTKKEYLTLLSNEDKNVRNDIFFFCTTLIFELDDLGYINCLRRDFDMLILIIFVMVSVIGKLTLMSTVLETCGRNCNILCGVFKNANLGILLFPECYELISMKPLKQQDYKIVPTSFLIAASPILYNYDVRNFPQSGILTQLYLYAAGVPLDNIILNQKNSITVNANDILCHLPTEWTNLVSIKAMHFDHFKNKRQEPDFKNVAPMTYNKEDHRICFSVLENDVYVVLHYISSIISCYMKRKEFLKDSRLFDIYEYILEDVVTKRKLLDNSFSLAKRVISNVGNYLKQIERIPNFYDTPISEKESFNFFSVNQLECIKRKKTSNQSPNVLIDTQKTYDQKGAIGLILYLSTILQIDTCVNLEPFFQLNLTDVSISFLDKEFFFGLLYFQNNVKQQDNSLHCLLNQKHFPMTQFGLGLCKVICALVNPINPEYFLKKLIDKLHARVPHEHQKTVDIPIPNLINAMFFLFKQHNILQWFYPSLLSTSLAYGGVSFYIVVKNCMRKTYMCEQNLLLPINKKDLLDKQCKVLLFKENISQEKETLEHISKLIIIDRFQWLFQEIYQKTEKIKLRFCDLFFFDLFFKFSY